MKFECRGCGKVQKFLWCSDACRAEWLKTARPDLSDEERRTLAKRVEIRTVAAELRALKSGSG